MRWSDLFGDLEAQFAAGEAAELAAEVADRTRREVGLVRLLDRLRASVGADVTAGLPGVGSVGGRLMAVGPDWLLLADPAGRETLVPVQQVTSLSGLGADAEAPDTDSVVASRLDLRYALRGLARSRTSLAVGLTDGRTVTGTIDRVGADFVELARHEEGAPRRRTAVRGTVVLPLSGVVLLRAL